MAAKAIFADSLLHAPVFAFRLFGSFRVLAASGDDLTPRGRKARALLAVMALGDGTVERARIAELLWSDRAAGQARASLRQVLFDLHGAAPQVLPLVTASSERISRCGARWRTDVGDVLACASAGVLPALAHNLDALHGDLLEGLDGLSADFDNWLRVERVRQREAVVAAGLAALDKAEPLPALAVINALEAFDPGNEQIVRLGLRHDSAIGDVAALHRRYQRLVAVLAREFGVRPSIGTQSLFAQLSAPPRLVKKRDDVAADGPVSPLVAVLAFENLSQDPALGFFSDGIAEELRQSIARTEGLRVIGRASSFQFRDADRAAGHVGQLLGATHVLDGSVRRGGERMLVSASLIETDSETVVWSGSFHRDLGDALVVQDEIAGAIAAVLKARFVPLPQAGRVSPHAYDLYLQGRRIAGPVETRQQCIGFYEAAIAESPDFAAAWSALALARLPLGLAATIDCPAD